MARRDRRVRKRLLRAICRVLRHQRSERPVTPVDRGFITITGLALALRQLGVSPPDFTIEKLWMLLAQESERFEIQGDSVRARYGHSVPYTEFHGFTVPPETLYHGTSAAALDAIRQVGLRPMQRCFVHLTSDLDYARRVALRAGQGPTVLGIEAGEGHRQGIPFRQVNHHVWLVEAIPPRLIRFGGAHGVRHLTPEIEQRLAELQSDALVPGSASKLAWYHLCGNCTAKWFAPVASMPCPRCGAISRTNESHLPPWRTKSCSRPDAKNRG